MRTVFIALLALTLIVVGGVSPLLFPRVSKITEATFHRIEDGMALAEVEALLGGPAGDYTTGPTVTELVLRTGYHPIWASAAMPEWRGDDGVIAVGVDKVGRVTGAEWTNAERVNLGPIERLQWRFDRWWARVFESWP
jgi:hypothetical protein